MQWQVLAIPFNIHLCAIFSRSNLVCARGAPARLLAYVFHTHASQAQNCNFSSLMSKSSKYTHINYYEFKQLETISFIKAHNEKSANAGRAREK